jgi:hypothetical protein
MENLNKTIKKLTDEEYKNLLEAVTANKKNKPYQVMELARTKELNDSQMMEILEVNSSAYYTLKSRLIDKIASFLSQKPINALKEKVAHVGPSMFDENKFITINFLKDLEKQLIEYDLSNELVIVYKALARLNIYNPEEYEYYEQLYQKHTAYYLSVEKAEDLLYVFIRDLGIYKLTRLPEDMAKVKIARKELFNICELYESHRLFVLYNIIGIYYQCSFTHKLSSLKAKEIEIENILLEINKTFEKYDLDSFYHNTKAIVDFLYVQFYYHTDNSNRAEPFYKRAREALPILSNKHIFTFHLIQFLNAKLEKHLINGNVEELTDVNYLFDSNFEIDENETYHNIYFNLFIAHTKFYNGNYSEAAKVINDLRNKVSMRHYVHTDVECKLFQALQYCLMGEDEMCKQLFSSISRQLGNTEDKYENVELFIKIIKAALKPAESRKKIKRIEELYSQYCKINAGELQILRYVKLDEKLLKRMANPIKNSDN